MVVRIGQLQLERGRGATTACTRGARPVHFKNRTITQRRFSPTSEISRPAIRTLGTIAHRPRRSLNSWVYYRAAQRPLQSFGHECIFRCCFLIAGEIDSIVVEHGRATAPNVEVVAWHFGHLIALPCLV